MSYHRADMNRAGVTPAADLRRKQDGVYTRIAGVVICANVPVQPVALSSSASRMRQVSRMRSSIPIYTSETKWP
jgi:hypothetical protein